MRELRNASNVTIDNNKLDELTSNGILIQNYRNVIIKNNYFEIMKEQRAASGERHREFDVTGIFRRIILDHATDFTRALPKEKYEQLPILLAEAHRAASRFRLQPYPGVEDTIRQLHLKYKLAIISDAQTPYALPELHAAGHVR